jgi:hypothetical protein
MFRNCWAVHFDTEFLFYYALEIYDGNFTFFAVKAGKN